MPAAYFTKQTFNFLQTLAENNNRGWFDEHKQDYENFVRSPALDFISDMAEVLPAISPHFHALPKKVGGSLMRVQRDIRFSHDKSPYKTNIGIQFRHEVGKDIHAPGYYVHIEPNDCFVGVGLWRPDADALFKIRRAIVENSPAWMAARDDQNFQKHFALTGDALINAPRGFAKDHPHVADLKRRDFIGLCKISQTQVLSKNFQAEVLAHFKHSAPFMRFLCKALALRH